MAPVQSPTATRLLTEREVAGRLGISIKTLQRWRWAGAEHLPFHKIGRAVRYAEADVDALLASGRHAAAA